MSGRGVGRAVNRGKIRKGDEQRGWKDSEREEGARRIDAAEAGSHT